MKQVVSFSGGRTSAYLCKVMIEKFGRENVDFIFMDTGAEHPKTYEFIKNVNEHFNLNLTCLRGDFTLPIGKGVGYKVVDISECKPDLKPYSEMMAKYGVPYIGGMFCTDRMKLKPFKKYCDDKYGKCNYETWLGIRADEPARLVGKDLYLICKKSGMSDDDIYTLYINQIGTPEFCPFEGMFTSNHIHYSLEQICEMTDKRIALSRKNKIHNMAEITTSDKSDVLNFWSDMPFDLGIDEWLGNCVFCPKKSDLKLAAAQRDELEMYHNFLEILEDNSVRIDNKTGVKEQMYRGKKSLQQVVAMFDGSTGSEIKSRIRGAKMTDTNSCSESCEVFNDETQHEFDF
jgi:hypothetical protein